MLDSAYSYVQYVPFSSDIGMKTVAPAPLLYINDKTAGMLINQISHCQDMLSMLINVLDSTFLQAYNPLLWHLPRISCSNNN